MVNVWLYWLTIIDYDLINDYILIMINDYILISD